jgi:hypothetical protein
LHTKPKKLEKGIEVIEWLGNFANSGFESHISNKLDLTISFFFFVSTYHQFPSHSAPNQSPPKPPKKIKIPATFHQSKSQQNSKIKTPKIDNLFHSAIISTTDIRLNAIDKKIIAR